MAEYYRKKRSEESGGSAEEDDMLLNFIKKRKLYCSEREYVHGGDVESPENSVSSAASVAPGCSADDDDDSIAGVSPDLEDLQCEGLDTEISMAINCRIDQSSTPTSEICGDSEQWSLESTPHAASPHRNSASFSAAEIEEFFAAAEIEEFFAAAEKYEQKRFAEKYNYDIVKDCPLEGKYDWVPLHP